MGSIIGFSSSTVMVRLFFTFINNLSGAKKKQLVNYMINQSEETNKQTVDHHFNFISPAVRDQTIT